MNPPVPAPSPFLLLLHRESRKDLEKESSGFKRPCQSVDPSPKPSPLRKATRRGGQSNLAGPC